MNTLIITGGNIDVDLALKVLEERYDNIIGVDKGLEFCYEQKLKPDYIVGDFDSLSSETLTWYREHTGAVIREFRPEKDATDTQIAVELALEIGSRRIIIMGGTGSRLDHVLGNIQTLYSPLKRGVECLMLDQYNRIRLIQNNHCIRREEQYGRYFSLIPFTTEVTGVTLLGAKYPLTEYDFNVRTSGSLGVSNEILDEQVEICMKSGILILIESKDS